MGLDKEKTAPMRKKKKKVNAIVNHNYHNPHNSNTKRISLSTRWMGKMDSYS